MSSVSIRTRMPCSLMAAIKTWTFETFAAAARKHFAGSLRGKLVVSGGLGGMGGAQPLAATMNGACFLGIAALSRVFDFSADAGAWSCSWP